MRRVRNKFYWHGFNWGKVLWSVSTFSRGHAAQRDYTRWLVEQGLGKDAEGIILRRSSMRCPCSDYSFLGLSSGKREGGMGKGSSIFIRELCADVSQCWEDPCSSLLLPQTSLLLIVKQTFVHPSRMGNLSPRSVRVGYPSSSSSASAILSSPIPKQHHHHHLHLCLLLLLPAVMNKKCAKVQESP